MPTIDLAVETAISQSIRAAQVSSMFDVPPASTQRLEWHGDMPLDERPWHVGLIVGPSGSGKSTILNGVFGTPAIFDWPGASVIDDFDPSVSVDDVAQICQAVGFNTIPAWLRPHAVLSNGEKFRVDLARRLLEGGPLVTCDEFTSVVDRQVARIGAHAVQKYIRRHDRKFVAAACHYDLEEWLQPDWVFEPATMTFRWRAVQRRPELACGVHRAPRSAWSAFARFHYLTAEVHPSAKIYVLTLEGEPAACCAVMFRPHPRVNNIWGMSRLVTLPDYQGLGLAFALADRVASAYRRMGQRYHAYPAHPSLVRSFNRSAVWEMVSEPGMRGSNRTSTSTLAAKGVIFGGRPNAIFSYCGPMMEDGLQAERLVA